MKLRWIAILLSLLSITSINAQQTYNLKESVNYALANNFDLLKATLDQEAIKYKIKECKIRNYSNNYLN